MTDIDPATTSSRIYVSASSGDSGEIKKQGHTVALSPDAIAELDKSDGPGEGTRILKVAEPGGKTTVLARVSSYIPPPRPPMTTADVERALATTSRTDPPTFIEVVAEFGNPMVKKPDLPADDGDTTAWPTAAAKEVGDA